ncbi:carboxypeptidase-like regulatory domain-containing protein [Persicobacter sp. CCB-QB2]|uniref:carboxypeptidase-like regulatory domain-containing protein n=1 Tax=Persicobacter sp. CCB-QB2 TaxID=1561025 RepID=UPI0006A9877B|nr:carboxypeptidase-like regulatory domain-containing protein [Persicobacter sp. CCB-QB2]
MKAFLLSFLLFLPAISLAQENTPLPTLLHGQLLNANNQESIPFAHIVNISQKKGAISDEIGYFSINAQQGDTLCFRVLGYKTDTITLSRAQLEAISTKFRLEEETRKLANVNIYSYDNSAMFRKKPEPYYIPGINMNLNPPKKDTLLQKPRDPKAYEYAIGAIFNPVSTLYSAFSKKEDETRKMAKVLYEEQQEQLTNQKFNKYFSPEAISKLLNIETEEAEAFLAFYNPSKQRVYGLAPPEIIIEILNQYGEYLEQDLYISKKSKPSNSH